MHTSRLFLGSIACGCVAMATAQADPATVQRIVQHGKNENQVMRHLWHLCKNIGPRLTGSSKLLKACDWTMLRFKEFGLKNVHLDYWGEIPVGFERGARQTGRMVAPYEWDFEFTTPAWSPGTGIKRRGVAILEPTTMAEYEKVEGRLIGAWIITQPGTRPPGSERAQVDALLSKARIAGRVSGSRSDLITTSGRFAGLDFNALPKDVRITVRKKDMDRILYNLERGKEVKLEFDIQQRFVKGPKPVYNVVADIPGTEKPEEVVIVSGHLDSWDGPGSEGACDNGTGTMVALEAARILMATGAKPKRTIRFILWTGEEQGLHGSRAYVQRHRDKLDKISAVFVDDGGTNYQGGLTCTAAMEPLLKEALQPAMTAFPEFPMRIQVVERLPRGGGSDHAPFNAVGVPGFFWTESGRANYQHIWHTQNDKFEEAIPEYLVQSSVNTAAAAYILACAETLLPREQPSAAPTGGAGR